MKYLPSSMVKWKREAEGAFKEFSPLFAAMYHKVVMPLLHCHPPPTVNSFPMQTQGDERPSFAGTLIREQKIGRASCRERVCLAV